MLSWCKIITILKHNNSVKWNLKEPGEDIGGLATDNEESRVEFAEAGVQVFQTLQ